MDKDNICGLILAAGLSSRMGKIKMLMQLDDGRNVLERTVDNVFDAGIRHNVLVLGCHEQAIRSGFRYIDRVTAVTNPRYMEGMLTSVQAGVAAIKAMGGMDVFLLQPGDCPFAPPAIIEELLDAYSQNNGDFDIIVPLFEGKGGHPTLISMRYADEILSDQLPQGLKTLMQNHADHVLRVPVQFSRMTFDLDTEEDYQQALDMLRREKEENQ